MKRTALIFSVASAALALAVSAAQATGAANRTFVSGKGADAGACTRASPCQTFAYALAQTASGGEIGVLDPGDYGSVTIAQAVGIVNGGGGEAGLVVSINGNGAGITIQAGATDAVYLRGLTIQGTVNATTGIDFLSGLSLQIADCDIHGFSQTQVGSGIVIRPSTTSTFLISNTNVSDNADGGVFISPSGSAVVRGVIVKSTFDHDLLGVYVSDSNLTVGVPLKVDIVDSVISNNRDSLGNTGTGITAVQRGTTTTTIKNSQIVDNIMGLFTNGGNQGTRVTLSHSTVRNNKAYGYRIYGGPVYTYGDNVIDGNGANQGSLTPAALQ